MSTGVDVMYQVIELLHREAKKQLHPKSSKVEDPKSSMDDEKRAKRTKYASFLVQSAPDRGKWDARWTKKGIQHFTFFHEVF